MSEEQGTSSCTMESGPQEQLPETSEIRRLDADTVRRITAEQAISDLSSIVKELMDNALDAESTTIKIRLFGHGLDIIEVSDDGNGVPIGSRPYLATRHATSKIERLEDIYEGTGLTMGFRGEALFAMACVSDSLVVASRTDDDELATKLVFGKDGKPMNNNNKSSPDGGEILPRKVGTTVAVVKPFGNLPARRADLVRRIKQERTRIFKLVESYGIFNVGVCFCLMDMNRNREDVALVTSASSTKIEETASTLLGQAFLKGTQTFELCLESYFREKQKKGGGQENGGKDVINDDIIYNWGIRGLISAEPSVLAATNAQQHRPQRRGGSFGGISSSTTSKPASGKSRIVQYYSINGRVVDLPKVTALLKRLWLAFSSSIGLKQKKPSALLELTLPNDAFDINLSPDKKSVLLTHEEELLGIIEEYVTKIWSDESSNVFVDGGLSQMQQESNQNRSAARSDEGDGIDSSIYEKEDEGDRKEQYGYEYDEEDFKHKRRFAFVHDISKAKMQHDMAERRAAHDSGTNDTSESCNQIGDGPRALKQMKLSAMVEQDDVVETRKRVGASSDGNLSEYPPSTSKKTKFSPKGKTDSEENSSPTSSTIEEGSNRSQSPVDRVTDLDRRKWTEIQSKFIRENDADNEVSTKNLFKYTSVEGDQNKATKMPTKAPVTPEDSMKGSVPSSRQRLENLQQFSFQSNDQKCSQHVSNMPPPDDRPANLDDHNKSEDISRENETITCNEERKERDPSADDDQQIQNENLNDDSNDAMAANDEPVVWECFYSTEDICLSSRSERLNMRKRKKDIDLIRKSIRDQENGMRSIGNEEPHRGHSGIPDGAGKDVDKEVAFDDDDLDSSDNSGFIRMPKSTFRNGMEVIGQFNLGFILAKCSRNHLWILDQHASDEKYNYEQLCKKTVMHRQPLIQPLKIELSPSEEACVLDHMDIFEANGFRFSFDEKAPICHRLSLMALPHSGAHEGRKAVQFGPSDISALCSILTEGSAYDAGSGGTGTDGSGMYGNNAVRRNAGTGAASADRSDRLLARLPKAIAMFASRACRTSIMIGTALSEKEMNSIVQKLAKVDMPWNCPHGRPTMRHVANVLPIFLKDERRAADHIAVPTITVVPATQEEEPGN